MRRAAAIALAAAAVVPVSATAGAGTSRPPVGLTATPAHVALAGSASGVVRVVNAGLRPIVVDAGRAGFSLDRRGRPRILARAADRAATAWLTVRPRRFVLRAGAMRWLTITSRLPRRVEPGDHDALVLLTTSPLRGRNGIAMRMRLGVVVVVRAPGRVVRRIDVRRLHVVRRGRARVLELLVVNRGNVTETLDRAALRVVLRRGGRRAMPHLEARELRPRTNGIVQLAYRGRLRGWVTARVQLTAALGRPALSRTFRVRL